MAKIGCLKPFRGTYNALKDLLLEDGEIAFETTNKRIYMGNGTDILSALSPFLSNSGDVIINPAVPNRHAYELHYPNSLVIIRNNRGIDDIPNDTYSYAGFLLSFWSVYSVSTKDFTGFQIYIPYMGGTMYIRTISGRYGTGDPTVSPTYGWIKI